MKTQISFAENKSLINFTENISDYDDQNLSIQAKNLLSMYHSIERKLSILPVVLMIAGTLGNMIAFYVLTRKKLRNQSTMLYFSALTVVDTISLYQWNFNFFYKYRLNSQNQNLEDQSLFLCRYVSFMAHFSMQTSAWILTIISIDRYFLISNSYWKQKFSRNIKFSLIVILSLILTIGLINLPVVFFNGKIQNKNFRQLTFSNELEFLLSQRYRAKKVECYTTSFVVFWQKVAFSLECVFPLVLMVIFNLLLIKRTQKSSKRCNKNDKCAKFKINIKKSTSVGGNLNPKIVPKFENSQIDLSSTNDQKIASKDASTSSDDVIDNSRSSYLKPFSLDRTKLDKKFSSDEASLNKNGLSEKKKPSSDSNYKNLSLSNLIFVNQSKPKGIRKNNSFLTVSNFLKNKNSCLQKNLTSISNTSISNRRNDSGETTRSLILGTDSYRSSKKYYLNYRNRRIVLMLSLLTLSFTISTLPSSVFYTFFRPIINNKPYKRLLTLSFNVLRHLSHTFNFIIYFTSSSVIKQQLKEIFNNGKFGKWSFNCCFNSIFSNFFLNNCLRIKVNNSISISRKDADIASKNNDRELSGDEEFRMKVFALTPCSLPSHEGSSVIFRNQNDIEFIDCLEFDESLDNKNAEMLNKNFLNKNKECDSSRCDLIKIDIKPININVPKLMLNSQCILKNLDQKPKWF